MKIEDLPSELKLPEKAAYQNRKLMKCIHCERPAFYDYTPYSLANPLMWLLCGHGDPSTESKEIEESEFCKLVMAHFNSESLAS